MYLAQTACGGAVERRLRSTKTIPSPIRCCLTCYYAEKAGRSKTQKRNCQNWKKSICAASAGEHCSGRSTSSSMKTASNELAVVSIMCKEAMVANKKSPFHGDLLVSFHYHSYTRTHTHTHTHTHTRTRTHAQTHTRKHAHTRTYTNTHTHTRTYTHTYQHTHARAHTHTHTRTHKNTHTLTHTCTQTHTTHDTPEHRAYSHAVCV